MRAEPITEKERWQRIQAAIARLRSHLKGRTERQFLADGVLSDAVLMLFSTIGEEVRYANEAVLAKYTYPWHQVRAFRNLIAHDYFGVRLPACGPLCRSTCRPWKRSWTRSSAPNSHEHAHPIV